VTWIEGDKYHPNMWFQKIFETSTLELIQLHGFFESSWACKVPDVEIGPKNLLRLWAYFIWCVFGPPFGLPCHWSHKYMRFQVSVSGSWNLAQVSAERTAERTSPFWKLKFHTGTIQKKIDQKSTKNRPLCRSPFRDLHWVFWKSIFGRLWALHYCALISEFQNFI